MNIKDMKNELKVIFAKANQIAERDIDEMLKELDSIYTDEGVKQKYFAFSFVLMAFIELYNLPVKDQELMIVFAFFAGLCEKSQNKK